MPAYNEEGAIEAAVGEIRAHVLDRVPGSELVVVDDGSRDATGKILDGLAAQEPRLKVIHQPNGGHGRALMTGLDAARGEWLFMLDSDRQIPLEEFGRLWESARAHRGAFGVRAVRHDPLFRRVLSKSIRGFLRWGTGVRLRDPNVPFKIVPRATWTEARALMPDDTLAPSLFLAVFARIRRLDIEELEVVHRERATGTVTLRRMKLLRFCARAFRQLTPFIRAARS
jgi:glycosyltransferase involved in cell wall biosynthesis